MKMRKLLALLLALLMVVSVLAACAPADDGDGDEEKNNEENKDNNKDNDKKEDDKKEDDKKEEIPEDELADTLTVALSNDPESFNPWIMAHDARQRIFYNTIYEPLAQLNVNGELELIIAKEYTKNEDGSYSLEIWDNVYDSKGNHITASDVVFSFQKCVETGQLAWAVRYLDHFDIVNDYELTMYLNNESAVGFNMLMKTCHIVSQKEYEASADGFATSPVGTGPYVLTEYTPGASAQIKVRDDYWQTDDSARSSFSQVGSIKTVDFKVITDGAQRALALEMGDVDVATGLSNIDLSLFLDADRKPLDGYNSVQYLNALIYYLTYNCGENSALADVEVRQAISYAIDTDAIAANIWGTDGAACTTNSSPFYADYDEKLNDETSYKYDPDKAKDLLEGKDVTELTLIAQNDETSQKMATLIQSYLGDVGITVNPEILDSALFTSTANERTGTAWDIMVDCVMSINTPGRFADLDLNSYQDGKNGCFINDPTLQEKFLAANLASSYSKETVTDLLEYLDETCYIYPVGYSYGYIVTSDKFKTIAHDRNFALIYGGCVVTK